MQLLRSLAVTMEMFVLLTAQTRGKGGWRCALERCGELCVVGAIVLLVWCADSSDSKWTKEQVCLMNLNLHKCSYFKVD